MSRDIRDVLVIYLDIFNILQKAPQELQQKYNDQLSDYLIYTYQISGMQYKEERDSINIIISKNLMNKIHGIIDIILWNNYIPESENELRAISERLQLIELSISENRIKQVLCCKQEMISIRTDIKHKKQLKCNLCGKITNISKKTLRNDKHEYSQKNSSYQAIKHFDTIFKCIFVAPVEHIGSNVKEELKSFMERDQKYKVTIDDVRQYLKQLSTGQGSKLNKMDAIIMSQLNGESMVRITHKEYSFIKDVYQQAVGIFYTLNDNRKNTPNCTFFIKSIIDLFYKDFDKDRHQKIVKYLYQQKELTILKIQKKWNQIKGKLDIPTLKVQFEDVMRSVNSQHDPSKNRDIVL